MSPPGVLINDKYDPSCPASEVSVHLLTPPQFGVVTLTPSGGFTYKVGLKQQSHSTLYQPWGPCGTAGSPPLQHLLLVVSCMCQQMHHPRAYLCMLSRTHCILAALGEAQLAFAVYPAPTNCPVIAVCNCG